MTEGGKKFRPKIPLRLRAFARKMPVSLTQSREGAKKRKGGE